MKAFVLFLLLGSLVLGVLVNFHRVRQADGQLRIVFCDVGQGDSIYIRTPGGTDILYDGGPDQKVLTCLADKMPFWDRAFELVFLSHPHADHLLGLIDVMERYSLEVFGLENLANETAEYRELEKRLERMKVVKKYLTAGDTFRTKDGVVVTVLGPSKAYLERTSPDGMINSKEFASLILRVSYKDFDLLLTGDSQAEGLSEAITRLGAVEVLHVPHHGSHTGLTSELLGRLKPKVSIISVGKNRYGHPAKETLELLQGSDSLILRTDRQGDIEIVSDGKQWEVR